MNYLVTGLICSGKSTFLEIAKKNRFDIIKADDIVTELYDDKSITMQLKKYCNTKLDNISLKDDIRRFFFKSKKNREIVESIFHPLVHQIINQKFKTNHNMMIELPPIINNYDLFQSNNSIYIEADKAIRSQRYLARRTGDTNYFEEINNIQKDFELIKSSCQIHIQNDSDIDALNKYFNKGMIKL